MLYVWRIYGIGKTNTRADYANQKAANESTNHLNKFAGKLTTIGVASLALGAGFGIGQGCMLRSGDNAARQAQKQNYAADYGLGSPASAAPGDPAESAAPAMGEAAAPVTATRSSDENNTISVARNVSPAVVTIFENGGLGSGVIIDGKNGIILTNNHVVAESGGQVEVKLKNAKTLRGRVMGTDPAVDIAVVKVDANDLPQALLGDSDKLEVGQTAIAIGNPLGLEQTLTHGVVSALNRKISPDDVEGFIQTDAAINPGNSGGPLLDSQGRVIGINTAVLRGGRNESAQSLGFAVPINVARDVARQILSQGRVRRAIMGIVPVSVTPQIAGQYRLPVREGVLLYDVAAGSPAARAGLRDRDILTKMDSVGLSGTGDMLKYLRSKKPGDTITVSGVRPAGNFSVDVRLAASGG